MIQSKCAMSSANPLSGSLIRHVRAIAVLGVGLALLLLGFPGLDFLKADRPGALGDLNRARIWLVAPLEPLQRPARIAQSWGLYRDGASRVRRLEIRVDGVLRHRSLDPEADWLALELRSRRLRPVMESSCQWSNSRAHNWRGLTRFVAARALEDWPEAREVTLTCTSARFPGQQERPTHQLSAHAPAWHALREVL